MNPLVEKEGRERSRVRARELTRDAREAMRRALELWGFGELRRGDEEAAAAREFAVRASLHRLLSRGLR